MAKGKRKRGQDAKLRVIAGGAAPKAVVTKRPTPAPSARPAQPNLRRDVEVTRRADAANDAAEATESERESAVAAVPRKSPFPRALIFAGLVVALGVAAYALTRNSLNPTTPTPAVAPTSPAPVEWTASSQLALPLASTSAPVIESASAPVVASTSAPVIPSVSAAPPEPPAPAVTPSVVAPPPIAPKPIAPPPPPPPPPKAPKATVDENPYQ